MELLESYELTLTDFAISRVQMNLPTAEIPTVKIDSVKRLNNRSLIVSGNGFQIVVPKEIEHFDEIEAALSQIQPIVEKPGGALGKFGLLLPLAFIVLMLVVFVAENPIVVLVGGILLLVGLGYSAISVLRNKNFDSRTKRAMWFVPLVMLSIIANIYFKRFGYF